MRSYGHSALCSLWGAFPLAGGSYWGNKAKCQHQIGSLGHAALSQSLSQIVPQFLIPQKLAKVQMFTTVLSC